MRGRGVVDRSRLARVPWLVDVPVPGRAQRGLERLGVRRGIEKGRRGEARAQVPPEVGERGAVGEGGSDGNELLRRGRDPTRVTRRDEEAGADARGVAMTPER